MERIRVGVHFSRHRGGPGWITVEPGRIELTGSKGSAVLAEGPVRVEVKRFEPPWGNHWIAIGEGHAVVSRKRAERILALAEECGFTVERS